MKKVTGCYVVVQSNSERTWVGSVYLTKKDAEDDLKRFGYMKENCGNGYFMMEPGKKGLRRAYIEPRKIVEMEER